MTKTTRTKGARTPPKRAGGGSHRSCSKKRTALKERIRALESELRIQRSLVDVLLARTDGMLPLADDAGEE